MNWSVRLWVVAMFAAMNLSLGCSTQARWPAVRSIATPEFAQSRSAVRSVDVLPVDVQVWTRRGANESPQAVQDRFDTVARGAINAELAGRGYAVAANLDWNGDYLNGRGAPIPGMPRNDLLRTTDALSTYGTAVAASKGVLLPPYLPYRLGEVSRADATLYVGGWAYVGQDKHTSTGEKVAKGVLIALLVVAVLVVVIAVARKGKGGSGVGKVAGGAAKGAAKGAARAATVAARHGGRAVANMAKAAGRVTGGVVRAIGRNGTWRMPDSFGRTYTHIDVRAGRPDYYREETTPKRGRSQMMLELTMVDNRTGRVLWHVRQLLPANASRAEQVQKAMKRMLSALPASA